MNGEILETFNNKVTELSWCSDERYDKIDRFMSGIVTNHDKSITLYQR